MCFIGSFAVFIVARPLHLPITSVSIHSRDIFKEQHVFEGVTRLFLRAVSRQSFNIPTPAE